MNRDALTEQLIIDEGLRLKPYVDTVGKTTIGVGRNLTDVGISKSEAVMLLGADIDAVVVALDAKLPWWRTLSDVRQNALANMAFNLGINRLMGFANMLSALKSGDYAKAADEALNSTWARQVSQRANRIADAIRKG